MPLNDTPLSTDSLSVSQNPIRTNFSTINTAFAIDHVVYGSVGQGKHNKVTMPLQVAAPAFAANEMGLFNQNTAVTNRPDIWMARAAATPFPITGYQNGAIAANSASCWTYLPSGLKIISGQGTTVGGTATLVFATVLPSFPGFSSFICNINAIRIDNSGSSATVMRVRSFTLAQVVIGLANGSTDSTFFWSVMGL